MTALVLVTPCPICRRVLASRATLRCRNCGHQRSTDDIAKESER